MFFSFFFLQLIKVRSRYSETIGLVSQTETVINGSSFTTSGRWVPTIKQSTHPTTMRELAKRQKSKKAGSLSKKIIPLAMLPLQFERCQRFQFNPLAHLFSRAATPYPNSIRYWNWTKTPFSELQKLLWIQNIHFDSDSLTGDESQFSTMPNLDCKETKVRPRFSEGLW
jgi:hypothetical protein